MQQNVEIATKDWAIRPCETDLRAANVNPDTLLATDFLNLFNEYIMLAELVADGSMEHDVLGDWLPIDYETHFLRSGFAGATIVLAAYRSMDCDTRQKFEEGVGALIASIMAHQECSNTAPELIETIKLQRDMVAASINSPAITDSAKCENTQADIDALFD